MISTIGPAQSRHYLTFDCGEPDQLRALSPTDYEPNGSFWEGVVQFLAPDLVEEVELDSEGSAFFAYGHRTALEGIQAVVEPLLADPSKLLPIVAAAEAAGVELED